MLTCSTEKLKTLGLGTVHLGLGGRGSVNVFSYVCIQGSGCNCAQVCLG